MSKKFIPYGRQYVDKEDIGAVIDVLRSDFLTTGPKVEEFENAVASYVGSKYAVVVSSGTAALHCVMNVLDVGPGDEVIVPPITFVASANCIVYMGGTPVFTDVQEDTLLINPEAVENMISKKTKAIIAVDFAGHPCDYDSLKKIAERHNLSLVADSCHALGAEYRGQRCGSIVDLSVFSFHPLKHITAGEGGIITTNSEKYAQRMRRFRNHGISADHVKRAEQGTWYYEMVELGHNYRITDFQCALGISQLKKLPRFLDRRRGIAARYDESFQEMSGIELLAVAEHVTHAYHLYVVRVLKEKCGKERAQIFQALRNAGIGVNVHYIPVHLHPFYRERFGTGPGLCPIAENVYEEIITLPIHPGMSGEDVSRVIKALGESL